MSQALIMMAKAPNPGYAKTRLTPVLGEQGAAQLATKMLKHTTKTCINTSHFNHIELCVSPNRHHLVFDALNQQYPAQLHWSEQGSGDLGVRMRRAFERLLQTHDRVVMLGTDAPDLTAAMIDQAGANLAFCDTTFIPALDGGYALIGLKKILPELFETMPWSTNQVMQTTRERLANAGWSIKEQAPIADIDEPEDLKYLPSRWL